MNPIPKAICSVFTIYLSLVILFGYYLDILGYSLTYEKLVFLLLIYLLVDLVFKNPLENSVYISKIKKDTIYPILFFIVFLTGFIMFLLPSLPSFLPLGSNVDSPQAYAITKLITDSHSLLFSGQIYSEYQPIWNIYPFGLHLNVALLSWITDIPSIKLIYPFMALVVSLSVAAIYGMVLELNITKNKYVAAIPSFLLLTFVLLNLQMRLGGPFPRLFGAFLVVMFVWLLLDYIKKPSLGSMIPLILIESAVIHSYTTFTVIPPVIFAFTHLFIISDRKIRIQNLVLFTGIIALLNISYITTFYFTTTYFVQQGILEVVNHPDTYQRIQIMPFNPWFDDESIYVNMTNLVATLFFIMSIPGFLLNRYNKKFREFILFYGVILLQILAFLVFVILFDMRLMPINNTIYVFMYPAAISIFLGLKKYINFETLSKKANISLFISMVVITLLAGQVMSLGASTGLTGRELGINQEEYDTALWVKDNIPDDVAVVTDPGAQFFFFIASEQKNITLVYSSYENLNKQFENWQAEEGTSGKNVVVLNINKVASNINYLPENAVKIDGITYKILYKNRDSYVLQYV